MGLYEDRKRSMKSRSILSARSVDLALSRMALAQAYGWTGSSMYCGVVKWELLGHKRDGVRSDAAKQAARARAGRGQVFRFSGLAKTL